MSDDEHTHCIRVNVRPPTRREERAHEKLTGTPWPRGSWTTKTPLLSLLMVLWVPGSWRWAHEAFANFFGYFWIPCPRCGREYGGHEMGRIIADPARGPGAGTTVCRWCSWEITEMEARL